LVVATPTPPYLLRLPVDCGIELEAREPWAVRTRRLGRTGCHDQLGNA
jgi:hypothetical protein